MTGSPEQGGSIPLPDTLEACHALIRRLSAEIAEVRRHLAAHEQSQRQALEGMYGKGVTPESLLNFGRTIAGKGGGVRSTDPTCGEVFAQARAAERERRKQERRSRTQSPRPK